MGRIAHVVVTTILMFAGAPGRAETSGSLPRADPDGGEHAVHAGAAFSMGAYHRASTYDDGDYILHTQGGFSPGFLLWGEYWTKYLGGGLEFRMAFPGPKEVCTNGICLSNDRLEEATGERLRRGVQLGIFPYVKARYPTRLAEPYFALKFGYLFYNDDPQIEGYGNGVGLSLALGTLFKFARNWGVSLELEYLYGSTWFSEDKKIRFATNAINLHLGVSYLF